MKTLLKIFLLVLFCQPIFGRGSYTDSLDTLIEIKIENVASSSHQVAKVINFVRSNMSSDFSLHELDNFLNEDYFTSFLFCQKLMDNVEDSVYTKDEQQANLQDIKTLLGVKLYVYYLESCKQKMLNRAARNYEALNYWEHQKFYEEQAFYKRNILEWFSSASYQARIQDNIDALQDLTFKTNSFIGLLEHNQRLLAGAQTAQEFAERCAICVTTQNELLENVDPIEPDQEINAIVKLSIIQAQAFNQHLRDLYDSCQMPSHIVRHWKAYTMSAAAAAVCAYVYLHYGDQIIERLQNNWSEYCDKPVKQAIEKWNGVVHTQELDVKKLENQLRESIEQAYHNPAALGLETLEDNAFDKNLDRLSGGKYSEIGIFWKRYQEFKNNHPNMLWGDVYKWCQTATDPVFPDKYQPGSREGGLNKFIYLSTWVQGDPTTFNPKLPVNQPLNNSVAEQMHAARVKDAFDVSFEEKAAWVEQNDYKILADEKKNFLDAGGAGLRKSLKEFAIPIATQWNNSTKKADLVLGLMTLIPLATVVGGSLFASKNVYNSVAYEPIRIFVRHLDTFLNECLQQPVSFDRQGKLCFLTEQLKFHVGVLTVTEQKMLQADIASLQAADLDYVQKYNVVQRMYRTYPCLVPGAI